MQSLLLTSRSGGAESHQLSVFLCFASAGAVCGKQCALHLGWLSILHSPRGQGAAGASSMAVWARGHGGLLCDLSSPLRTPLFTELSFCCIPSFVLVTHRPEDRGGRGTN